MALTKVNEVCSICNKNIDEGDAIFITKVHLTKNGRSGPGDGGMSLAGL